MKLAAAAAVIVIAAAHPADACGVPDFGATLAAVAEAFTSTREPVHTPVLVVGGGTSTEGTVYSVGAGYAWGVKESDWLFPGSTVTRVVVGVRSDGDDTAVSATYGWYQNRVISAGLDLGAEAQVSGTQGLGPTGRLTLGIHGVALRLTGTAKIGDVPSRFTGAAELVFELMDLTGRI